MKRREKSARKRLLHHLTQMIAADSTIGRLRATCLWLVAEAVRHRQAAEVLDAVIDLVFRLRQRLPLPDRHPRSPRYEDLRDKYLANLVDQLQGTDRTHDALREGDLAQGTTPDRRDLP